MMLPVYNEEEDQRIIAILHHTLFKFFPMKELPQVPTPSKDLPTDKDKYWWIIKTYRVLSKTKKVSRQFFYALIKAAGMGIEAFGNFHSKTQKSYKKKPEKDIPKPSQKKPQGKQQTLFTLSWLSKDKSGNGW